MVKKRGQAAMEFLMTYGWALLVVLVAIGALAFFGVLNPAKFLPETCTITPGISCNDFLVNTTDTSIIIQNGMGKDLTSVSINSDTCTAASPSIALNDGGKATLTCPGVFVEGRYKGLDDNLELTYTEGTDFPIVHQAPINLITEVQ